jgi:hypothetical protein
LENVHFCSSSRNAKILTRDIHWVFRGLKFERDPGTIFRTYGAGREIGQKGTFCIICGSGDGKPRVCISWMVNWFNSWLV